MPEIFAYRWYAPLVNFLDSIISILPFLESVLFNTLIVFAITLAMATVTTLLGLSITYYIMAYLSIAQLSAEIIFTIMMVSSLPGILLGVLIIDSLLS